MEIQMWTVLLASNIIFRCLRVISARKRKAFRVATKEAKAAERESPPPPPLLLSRLASDSVVHFSGEALEEGRWWVILSATFDHADWPHLFNNMLMLLCVTPSLEAHPSITPLHILIVYLVTGAAGWALTLLDLRLRFKGDDWAYAAKFQTSVGASPATYGLCVCAAVFNPRAHSCNVWGIPAWLWLVSLACWPMVLSERYNLQWWMKKTMAKHKKDDDFKRNDDINDAARKQASQNAHAGACGVVNYRFLVFVPMALLFGYLVLEPCLKLLGGVDSSIPVGIFFALYLAKTLAFKVVDGVLLGRRFFDTSADNPCHLGGSMIGLLLPFVFLPSPLLSSDGDNDNEAFDNMRYWIVLACCFVYLVLKCVLKF